ncbi:protein inturned isoform X2 [Metopolophium dirhodum]|uniref:protein inturned isoform X2 n=1 Tax=Metopolophium dirhodum TaxID=44670 RepID=UPI00298F443C|nr:protein inturned isoform X2 [Metopolophium dirhodum]
MNENNVYGKSFKTYLSDTDSSSTHSSCECNDVNSIVSDFEWENEINDQGELFYVKCSPRKQTKYTKHNTVESNDAPKKTKTTAGKLVKLLKRKKRGRDRNDGSKHTGNSNKVTFLDTQEGEVREVTVEVENDSSSNLGRRATLTEKLFGLSTTVFEDGSRIMVASIIPNTPVDNQRSIKIGDWLKIINGEIVTAKTLDQILSNITPPTTVMLVVQRVAVSLVGVDKHNNQQLSSYLSLKTINDEFVSELSKYPVAVMYLISENSNSVYVYPGRSSIFNQIKGAFQTISHIVPQIVKNQTRSISMICDDQLVHSIFVFEGQGTFIFIAPDSKLNLTYADWMASNIARNLCFCYDNLNSCFSNEDNHCTLDKYFTIIFSELYDINMFHNIDNSHEFEKYLPASKSIPLLRSIQMELDDILNEFEANYVCEDTREPRPYLIIGTSIYYKEYLLSSHLNYEDHLDIHMFCLQNGLFHLLNSEYLERLIIFRRVYPSSVRSNSTFGGSVYTLPKAKWYLLIVGRGNNLMATLLEVGPCCSKNELLDGPNVEYVEEAEDTLESILNMNVDEVAEKWIEGNIMQIYQTESLKNAGLNMLANNKQSSLLLKKPEIISILKHKNDITSNSQIFNDSRQLDSCSETSLTSSGAPSTEDSMYVQGPVFGRRAERMMKASSIEWSDNSEDEYTVSDGSRSVDMTDVIKNLPVLPNKFGLGKLSMLFRYIDINCHTGVMLCSPSIYNNEHNLKTKDIFKNIDEKFNSTVIVIRDLFDDSNQDENEINEIGVLFQIPTSNTDSPKKSSMITFWVMGRLFKEPNKRELYVCYEEGTPQNMVEIAFKLGTNYATG